MGASRAPANSPMSQLAALPGPINFIIRSISAAPPPGWEGDVCTESLSATAVAAEALSLLHHTAGSHHHSSSQMLPSFVWWLPSSIISSECLEMNLNHLQLLICAIGISTEVNKMLQNL